MGSNPAAPTRRVKYVHWIVFFRMTVFSNDTSLSKAFPPSKDIIKRILPTLEKQIFSAMKINGFPGVSVAVVSRDQVFYLKSFGVKRLGKDDKITPDTLFQMASLSKPMSATLLSILQKKEILSLEASVKRFLPNFQIQKSKKLLKICHILNHTSGIPKEGFNDLIEASISREDILRCIQQTPLTAEPGKKFSYNNAVFGGVIENLILKITGKSFEQALMDEVFIPLGMKNASVGLESLLKSKDKAYPHVQNKEGRFIPSQSYSRRYYIFPSAAGVNASLQDLIIFLQLYLGKYPHIMSKRCIQQLIDSTIEDTEALGWWNDKKGLIKDPLVGLGWKLMTYATKKIVYHGGWLKGFRSFLGFLPQDSIGIIILTNAENMYPEQLALEFFDLYLGVSP